MQKMIRILAALSFAEGLIAFAWLASFPTEGQFFSPLRIISLGTILIISFASLAAYFYFRSESRSDEAIEIIENLQGRLFLSFLLITISLSIWVAILHKDLWLLRVSESTYTRLIPIAIYNLLLCLQAGWLFLFPDFNKNTLTHSFRSIWKPALLLFGIFLAAWLLVSASHLGLMYDTVGLNWGPPGTPITFAQVNLVFAISILLTFAFNIAQSGIYKISSFLIPLKDAIIFIGLWGLAVILWWNEPMSPTHFAPAVLPPNREYYPYSDALIFDKASYHLIYGTGFSDHLVRRPLYVGMLALFHKIAGTNYESTVFLQILVLAFIPSFIYFLTSQLSNRTAGLMAGGLIIFREKNAIDLSGEIVTSHAKLMMSDLITLLGVVLFVFLAVKMFSKEKPDIWTSGIAGACLGLIALIRAQVLILMPALFLFVILSRKPLRLAIKESLVILLGLALVMLPWIWRNWNLTGTFVLDDRGEERLLARNYSQNPISLPSPLEGETQQEFSARLRYDIITFAIEHPGDVLFFISNHFFRNMIHSALSIAPAYSTDSPERLVSLLPFWGEWNGNLPGISSVSLFINLAILALGIAIAVTKNKYAGWFPMVAFLFYMGGTALVRSSGWRFSLPADWIILMYYSIALAYLPSKILWCENTSIQSYTQKTTNTSLPRLGSIVFFFLLLLGASVPMAERIVPARDFETFTESARAGLLQQEVPSTVSIDSFLKQDNAVFLSGVALYPRYFRSNSQMFLDDISKNYRYLHFWLINDDDYQIVLPLQDSPEVFPHTSTLSVIGCKEDNHIVAWAVIMHTPSEQIIVQSPQSSLTCPLIEPN